MADKDTKPPEVFFFIESGGGETGRLCMSLNRDDADDMQVAVEPTEFVMLQGLYALAPDKFRRLMNYLVDAAYQTGFKHGAEEAEANEAVLMNIGC